MNAPLVLLQVRLLAEAVSALAAPEGPLCAHACPCRACQARRQVCPGLVGLQGRLVREDAAASDALERVRDHVGGERGVLCVAGGAAEVVGVQDGEDVAAGLALALHGLA